MQDLSNILNVLLSGWSRVSHWCSPESFSKSLHNSSYPENQWRTKLKATYIKGNIEYILSISVFKCDKCLFNLHVKCIGTNGMKDRLKFTRVGPDYLCFLWSVLNIWFRTFYKIFCCPNDFPTRFYHQLRYDTSHIPVVPDNIKRWK